MASKKQRGISFQDSFAVPTGPSETARKSCQQRMPMATSLEHDVSLWWQYAAPRHPRPVSLQSISRAPSPSRQRCFLMFKFLYCVYIIVVCVVYMGSAEEVRAGGFESGACMALTRHAWFAFQVSSIAFSFCSSASSWSDDVTCRFGSQRIRTRLVLSTSPKGGKHNSIFSIFPRSRQASLSIFPHSTEVRHHSIWYAHHYKWLQHYHLSRWKLRNNISAVSDGPYSRPHGVQDSSFLGWVAENSATCQDFQVLDEVHGTRALRERMLQHTVDPTKEHRSAQKCGGYFQRRDAHTNVPQPVCCIGDATWQSMEARQLLHDQLLEPCLDLALCRIIVSKNM